MGSVNSRQGLKRAEKRFDRRYQGSLSRANRSFFNKKYMSETPIATVSSNHGCALVNLNVFNVQRSASDRVKLAPAARFSLSHGPEFYPALNVRGEHTELTCSVYTATAPGAGFWFFVFMLSAVTCGAVVTHWSFRLKPHNSSASIVFLQKWNINHQERTPIVFPAPKCIQNSKTWKCRKRSKQYKQCNKWHQQVAKHQTKE